MTAASVARESAASASAASSAAIVTVDHLCKTYGPGVGVQDVSFRVNRGEIFGIIAPNGAGKTTTVECICVLRIPDSGDRPAHHRASPVSAGRRGLFGVVLLYPLLFFAGMWTQKQNLSPAL